MKNKILIPFKYLAMLGIALSLTFLTNCGDDDDVEDLVDATNPTDTTDTTDPVDDGLNIIETLQAAGNYDTLLYLLDFYVIDAEGTKLIDVLVTDGPFTLFAPNNDAFAALYDFLTMLNFSITFLRAILFIFLLVVIINILMFYFHAYNIAKL